MRKPPIPRAVPHRSPRERWATVGACGVLVLGHAARAAVDAPNLAYLSVLEAFAAAAALGVGLQLAFVDDAIAHMSAAGVAALLAAASIVSLTVGFPGSDPDGLGRLVPLITLVASAYLLFASAAALFELREHDRERAWAVHPSASTRRVHPRRLRLSHLAARAPRGTARAPEARRDPARPAA
jgi:hypothetical protein